ncbi:thioredoxin [bacterium]|nr:thioredoxin [bacterium]NCQ55704.1 thioredoxin [Candidatus Parcubacteria bacterium]NCS67653.1 thioredoxin [Candidatus Peregrinibacteria bacterium]NCS96667.1 thioredoxin [bacterium]
MAKNITTAEFEAEVLKSDDVVLVDFWAPWCGPCQMIGPVLEELSNEIGDGAKIVKINVDEESEIASKYGVMSIPALKVFKGGEIVDEAVGVRPKADLLELIERNR